LGLSFTSNYKKYRKFGGKSFKLQDSYSSKRSAKKAGKRRKKKVAFSIDAYRVKKKGSKYLLYVR